MDQLKITLSSNKKPLPPADQLGFGRYFTDHMLLMDYSEEKGWHDLRIVPYGPLSLDPSAMVFHYGQEVFEGMKAYRTPEGNVVLFRPEMNLRRMNASCVRMGMPGLEAGPVLEAICKLIELDEAWVPEGEGNSLYIRPFMIATEAGLGVRAAREYQFIVILTPVGAYYSEGIHPVRIYVEDQYVRAVRGGTGEAKTSGNYASGLKAQEDAKQFGFSQVLWLDGVEKKYIEEVGSMNVFFKVNGKVVTPELSGSILAGITRDSVLHLLREWGIPVEERRIGIDELFEAGRRGELEEAFGTGTAAVISPIGWMKWEDREIEISGGKTGALSEKLYNELTGIQRGLLRDPYGWRHAVK
ncbi:branched-chain amino acid aminotransferase [Paenibacillus sp. FSL R5-0527]|uniref:branched-chain amino acid aminotransferase n=1 Tax=Paenibacillus TaxID=44249 RepID=UPI00097A1713|nr:branched-chain amino acid aminotransferase [Paenibacillus macerans]MED4954918.1 branched-chain amino acid aminotransferase [Paenibacillus macerans]OMG45663.1 branched chain amino acid aminotransferase [Paenibacillus macerans]